MVETRASANRKVEETPRVSPLSSCAIQNPTLYDTTCFEENPLGNLQPRADFTTPPITLSGGPPPLPINTTFRGPTLDEIINSGLYEQNALGDFSLKVPTVPEEIPRPPPSLHSTHSSHTTPKSENHTPTMSQGGHHANQDLNQHPNQIPEPTPSEVERL